MLGDDIIGCDIYSYLLPYRHHHQDHGPRISIITQRTTSFSSCLFAYCCYRAFEMPKKHTKKQQRKK